MNTKEGSTPKLMRVQTNKHMFHIDGYVIEMDINCEECHVVCKLTSPHKIFTFGTSFCLMGVDKFNAREGMRLALGRAISAMTKIQVGFFKNKSKNRKFWKQFNDDMKQLHIDDSGFVIEAKK